MPRADDLPFYNFETRNVPCATNLLGIKGAGEAGAIPVGPLFAQAIEDALHKEGLEILDIPLSPGKLYDLCLNHDSRD